MYMEMQRGTVFDTGVGLNCKNVSFFLSHLDYP